MNRVAEWLKARRKDRGFDRQSAFAEYACLSLSTVQAVESAGDLMSRERATRKLLAIALQISMSELEEFSKGGPEPIPLPEPEQMPDEVLGALELMGQKVGLDPLPFLIRTVRWLQNQPPDCREIMLRQIAWAAGPAPATGNVAVKDDSGEGQVDRH